MLTHLTENIVRKSLSTQYIADVIPCYGYKYLSILTDGAFNPDPFVTGFLLHFILLKDSNRLIPIYGEMKNILLGKNTEIRYSNLENPAETSTVESGFGNIVFYLSNYPCEFMSQKENSGFQWEKSFELGASTNKYYHFGINRIDAGHTLAVPFIPDHFNKLVYLYEESEATTTKVFQFIFEDNDARAVTIVTDTLTELLLPAKRFRIHLLTGLSSINFNIMLKFLKA